MRCPVIACDPIVTPAQTCSASHRLACLKSLCELPEPSLAGRGVLCKPHEVVVVIGDWFGNRIIGSHDNPEVLLHHEPMPRELKPRRWPVVLWRC